jgi:hypothetical protein
MFPTLVLVHAEIDLYEWTPLGSLGFAHQMHPTFRWRMICFAGVAGDAGAHNVFPSRRPAAITRDYVVKIEVFSIENFAAILTGVVVPLENIVPGEFDFLFGKPVEHDQQDHPWDTYLERYGVDALRMGLLLGKILPLTETEGLEGAVRCRLNHMRVTFEE